MMFDGAGNHMTPSHAVKNGKRYRYYLSNNLNCGQGEGIRVPAHEIEDLVIVNLAAFLRNNTNIIEMLSISSSAPSDITYILDKAKILAQRLHQGTTADRRPLLLELIDRVVITARPILLKKAMIGRKD